MRNRFSGNEDEFVVDNEEQQTSEAPPPQTPKPEPMQATEGMTPDEMLNSLQKKVYVFDESGSMASYMPREDGKEERETKTQAVKRMMKRFVTDRFKKYPNSQISVLGFGTDTRVICEAGSKWKQVTDAVENLQADSSTDIFQAVEFAVKHIEDSPSQLKVNQIIFVSDGMDHGATNVKKLLGRMKKSNITFDFIFVNSYEYSGYSSAVEALRKLCKDTGGEFIEVSKASEFEDKFLEVSNRLALPPARG